MTAAKRSWPGSATDAAPDAPGGAGASTPTPSRPTTSAGPTGCAGCARADGRASTSRPGRRARSSASSTTSSIPKAVARSPTGTLGPRCAGRTRCAGWGSHEPPPLPPQPPLALPGTRAAFPTLAPGDASRALRRLPERPVRPTPPVPGVPTRRAPWGRVDDVPREGLTSGGCGRTFSTWTSVGSLVLTNRVQAPSGPVGSSRDGHSHNRPSGWGFCVWRAEWPSKTTAIHAGKRSGWRS